MIRQRLRGIVGTTIAAVIPWTALGLLTGVVFQLVTVCTLAGALVGVVNGLTFSGIVLATERGKSVEELHGWRFAA